MVKGRREVNIFINSHTYKGVDFESDQHTSKNHDVDNTGIQIFSYLVSIWIYICSKSNIEENWC